MNRRRIVLVGSIVVTAGAVVASACSFPDVEYGTGGVDGSVPDTSVPDDGAVSSDVNVAADGRDPDADIVQDAGGKVDAAGCTVCDCDGDGFNDLGKPGCADAGGDNDCDDTDTAVRPDQGFTEKKPYAPRNGDWNCKNGVEKYYAPNTKCTGNGGATCDGTFGFEEDPACGSTGSFITCKTSGATPPLLPGSCVVGSRNLTDKTQACK